MSCLIKPTLGWIIIVQKKISYSCNIFKQNHIESEWIVRGKKKTKKNWQNPEQSLKFPMHALKLSFLLIIMTKYDLKIHMLQD